MKPGDRVRHPSHGDGVVTNTYQRSVVVHCDSGAYVQTWAAEWQSLPDRTEPHDDRDGLSAFDILERVAAGLEKSADALEGDPGTLRAVARQIRAAVAQETP